MTGNLDMIPLPTPVEGAQLLTLLGIAGWLIKAKLKLTDELDKRYVQNLDYEKDKVKALEEKLVKSEEYNKKEEEKKEWMIAHVEERAEHKSLNVLATMLSKFQSLEDKFNMWMEIRAKEHTESASTIKEILDKVQQIEISCAGNKHL
jgi:hypothetical protein